jgi:thioesterase domain-containing protein
MAQRLLQAGKEVALLGLIELARPGASPQPRERKAWVQALQDGDMTALLRRGIAKLERDLSEVVRLWRTRYHLARGGTLPHDIRDYRLIECFTQAMARYEPQPYPRKLTVFRAEHASEYVHLGDPGPHLGWAPLALGGISVHVVPGGHHSLILEPHVQVIAAQFEACLRAAQEASSFDAGRPQPSAPRSAVQPGSEGFPELEENVQALSVGP